MKVIFDERPYSVQVFEGEQERIVTVEDRYYRVYRDGDVWYFMVRTPLPRSIRASWDDAVRAIVQVHAIYRAYEQRVSRAKQDAQRQRDRKIHEVVEHVQVATKP